MTAHKDIKPPTQTPEKNVFQKRLEAVLLTVCLCILALRAMYVESPHIDLLDANQLLTNAALSIIMSSVLLAAVALWFVFAFCSRRFIYRFSGIEIAVALFVIAGIAATIAASNKRAAITDMVTLLAPMVAAILLIQLLDSPSKITLVLFVVLALGATATYQCVDQMTASNEDMIRFYEEDPEASLKSIGAEVGSFEQMLYEHRLYGKDIRGFLTTSNSTGSYLLGIAFVAVGLFIDAVIKRKKGSEIDMASFCLGIVLAVIVAGLVITHSKGAIATALLCTLIMLIAFLLGKILYRHRRLVLVGVIIAIVAVSVLTVSYGRANGTLPGGVSMLVRWQYWEGAVKMYADKPFTGVGGGNFASHYTHYKIGAAPETVSDPHNFVLALLSQYGPTGLIAFLAGFATVLLKSIFSKQHQPKTEQSNASTARPWLTLSVIFIALLVIRPILFASPLGDNAVVAICAFFLLYLLPAAVFAVGFWLLWTSLKKTDNERSPLGKTTQIGIFIGIGAILVHNLIDFAIFEPGILTLLWTMTACLFALNSQQKNTPHTEIQCGRIQRIAAFTTIIVASATYLHFALVPTVKSGSNIQRALRHPEQSHELFDNAATVDPLSPTAANFGGKAYMTHYDHTQKQHPLLLESAAERFRQAIQRDPASFKNYEKLSRCYEMLADTAAGSQRSDYLQMALEQLQQAVRLYPGSGKLNFRLAQLAEKIGDNEIALAHYGKAIEIEDSYRVQFRIMYPDREMFSRLGETRYQLAAERISLLERE